MDNFFYLLVLAGGSGLAFWLFTVAAKKIAPSGLGKGKWTPAVSFIIQIVIPAIAIPILAKGALKNMDKMYKVTEEVGSSPYLTVLTDIFENAEASQRFWAMISLFLVFSIGKIIIESMPNNPAGFGAFAIAIVVVVVAVSGTSFLWDLVAEKIFLRSVVFFDSIWWDTTPGGIVREWWFPEATRIPPP